MEDNNRLSYFFLGMGIGVAIGVLFAPKSGEETRRLIREKADEGRGYVKNRSEEVKGSATELVDRGKDVVTRQKEQLAAAVEAGKQAYKEVAAWTRTLPPDMPVYSFGLSDYEFWYYNGDVDVILFRHSIRDAIIREMGGVGIFISSYPWSWGRENTALLNANCKVKIWPAAAYEEDRKSVV